MKYLIAIALLHFSLSSFANSSLPDNRHIAVTGTAQLQAKPDIAILHLEVKSTKTKSVDAKQDVDNRVNQLLDGLDAFKVEEDSVSASNISTRANYSYGNNRKREITGYTATRKLKITLDDLTRLNALMDFALTVKIDEIRNIELKSSQADKLKDQVNQLAVENAKQKGRSLANAFDAKLGRIYSINSTSNSSRHRYGANRQVERVQLSSQAMDQPARPGKYLQENIVFSASISVVFDLEVSRKRSGK